MKIIKTLLPIFLVLLSLFSCRKNQIERLDNYKYELIEYRLKDKARNNDIKEFSFVIDVDDKNINEIILETSETYGINDNGDSLLLSLGYPGKRQGNSRYASFNINPEDSKKSYNKSQVWSGLFSFNEVIQINLSKTVRAHYFSRALYELDNKKKEFKIYIYGREDCDGICEPETFLFKRTKL
ncbi:MAG: hypothetical protein ACI9XP_000529 [Lentimonas sp.]|jgi:hypothetical protein